MQRDKVPRVSSSFFIAFTLINDGGSSGQNGRSNSILCTTGAVRAWCRTAGSA